MKTWFTVPLSLLATSVLLSTATSSAQEYRIGIDDVLGVSVWDNKDVDQVVFVRPDGHISLPLAGEVRARGLTVAELEVKLSELYQGTIKGARVTVVVREIRSRLIFFIGGVSRPGAMQLTQELTILQAISQVGGPVPGADMESAFVLRGSTVIPVNFTQLIQNADITQNVKLEPGDTVVVPLADVLYVQGEVKSPATLRFTKGLTLLKAITLAGGLTNLAAPARVTLVRAEGKMRESIRVDLDDVMKGAAPDVPLRPNDIVIVPQRLF